MTGAEIKRLAGLYIPGIEIEDSEAVAVINEALSILGDLGLVYGQITVEAEAGDWLYLPEDATIVSVVLERDNSAYVNWKIRGNRIMFEDSGEFTINARRVPPLLTEILDEPDIHPMYQRCIVNYLRGFFKVKDDDTSQDGHRMLAKFEEDAMRTFNILRRQHSPGTIKVIR